VSYTPAYEAQESARLSVCIETVRARELLANCLGDRTDIHHRTSVTALSNLL